MEKNVFVSSFVRFLVSRFSNKRTNEQTFPVIAALTVALAIASTPLPSRAQSFGADTYLRARVVAIENEQYEEFEGIARTVQTARLRLLTGPAIGEEFTIENGVVGDRKDMRLTEGETVVVERLAKVDGTVEYQIREKYRLPAILWLLVLFFAAAVVLGGTIGFTSMLGLAVSIGILVLYVVPAIGSGANPLGVSLFGSFGIACTSLYLAHGMHRRTTVALLSTLLTLSISVLLAVIFVHVTKLFGTGSEEAVFLQLGPTAAVNLQGLLLGGIVIGCLGVLDDITTAQVAAVDEIRKANPQQSRKQLWQSGMSVGKEHIASLINTLALAYAGASLPLLLLFHTQGDAPLWLTFNSEFLAEEIIRTLVGSTTLLFAVPISTWLAVTMLRGNSPGRSFPAHHH